MKFVIAREELDYLLSTCLSVIPPASGGASPLLSRVLIEAKNGELILTATDLKVSIRCQTTAKVLEEGEILVSLKCFSQLIRELTANQIEFTVGESKIAEIMADDSKFKLVGMQTTEFPRLPKVDDATVMTLPQGILKEVLRRTAFSVARDDNRPGLAGVLMKIHEGTATFIGTDGKRMAKHEIPVTLETPLSGSYILPLKAVDQMLNFLGDDEEEATLYLLHDKVGIDTGSIRLVTKLIADEYPNVLKVIPEKVDAVFSLHRTELITLLRQVILFTTDLSRATCFTFVDGELKLKAMTAEVGEGHVSMPVNYQGPEREVAFDTGFFLDILRHSKEEIIKLGIVDAWTPGVVTDTEGEPDLGAKSLFVMMPVQFRS